MKYLEIKNNIKLINLCGHDDFGGMSIHHFNRFNALKPLIKDDMKILDLGCGSSVFFLLLKEFNSTIIPYGIDKEKLAIDASKELFPEYKNNFIHENIINIENIDMSVDMVMVSSQLLCIPKFHYVIDWMLKHGITIMYDHSVKKPFDSLRSMITNYNYSSISLSSDIVKVVSSLNRKSMLPSQSIEKLKKDFLISPYVSKYNFGYLNDIWKIFNDKNCQYYLIEKDGFLGIIAALEDEIDDVFIIKIGNLF